MSLRDFGEMVYQKRKKLKKTQVEMSKVARITQGTFSKLENGLAPLTLVSAVRVCRTLKIRPTQAFKAILS